jgi:fumarate reductase flavoprotein subunit
MLDVAECIVASAAWREESRGAHQRLDFPARDDEHFLAHSLAQRGPDGTCQVTYLPVTITRWPPGERVYGR